MNVLKFYELIPISKKYDQSIYRPCGAFYTLKFRIFRNWYCLQLVRETA